MCKSHLAMALSLHGNRSVACRHWYTDPDSMFNGRYTFDSMSVAKDSYVFASEYAVFDWGIPTIPRGNIQVRQRAHALHEHLLVDALCDACDVWLLLMHLFEGARYGV